MFLGLRIFLGFFSFHVSQVFKASALESFFLVFLFMHCWEFVLHTSALCQLLNLLKAIKKLSPSLFVPLQFK